MTTDFSSSRWRFRTSSTEDLDRLYEIWHSSVIATHDFLSPTDLSNICVQVKNHYLPNRPLLVAIDCQSELVGFMGMNGHEIDSLFLEPASRGCGLGRAFIEQASAKCPHLEVGVNAQNSQAVAFYKAVGFTAYALSPTDDDGRPYPMLRMRK